jgi:mRNA interferase MazF
VSGNANAPARGEIWWVDLNPTQGAEINKIRPCAIVGADPINRARSTVVVIPLSSSPKPNPPLIVPLPSAPKNAENNTTSAVLDQIRAVDKHRLKQYIKTLSIVDLGKLDSSLRQVLALS